MHWLKILEQLRKEQSRSPEDRPAIQLPLPQLHYEQEQIPDLKEEDRGVVVFDIYQNTWENS